METKNTAIEEQITANIKKTAMAQKKAEKVLPLQLFYYDIKVDALVPAVLTYRVQAETPEKAIEMIKGKPPNSAKYRLPSSKHLKLTVYKAGCSMILFIKNLAGR